VLRSVVVYKLVVDVLQCLAYWLVTHGGTLASVAESYSEI